MVLLNADRILKRVQRDFGRISNVDPHVDVRCTAEVPDERWPLQPPVIPDSIVAQVAFLVKCQVARVEAALRFQTTNDFVLIGLTEWFE